MVSTNVGCRKFHHWNTVITCHFDVCSMLDAWGTGHRSRTAGRAIARVSCWCRGKLLSISKRHQRLSQGHVMYDSPVDSQLKLNNHLTSSCLWQTAACGGSRRLQSLDWRTFAIGLHVSATTRLEVCRIVIFSLLVCATDSDLRSANASIAASNKRVLRFLLLLRFHCVKLSTFFTC